MALDNVLSTTLELISEGIPKNLEKFFLPRQKIKISIFSLILFLQALLILIFFFSIDSIDAYCGNHANTPICTGPGHCMEIAKNNYTTSYLINSVLELFCYDNVSTISFKNEVFMHKFINELQSTTYQFIF